MLYSTKKGLRYGYNPFWGYLESFFLVLYRTFMENGSIKKMSQSQRFFVDPFEEPYSVFLSGDPKYIVNIP